MRPVMLFTLAVLAIFWAGCTAPQAQGPTGGSPANASAGTDAAATHVTPPVETAPENQSAPAPTPLSPREACMMECQKQLETGADLSKGPCLSNEIAPDWVCDVAHNPRQAVDDEPANQCPAYWDTAHHFVEVDPQCNFITEV